MFVSVQSKVVAFAVGLGLPFLAASAHGAQIVDVVNSQAFVRGTWANFGYSFTVNQPVRVSALGLWDYGANGLADAHPVGIWDDQGTLMAQALVDATSPATPSVNASHAWRFTDIAPLELAAGQYKIGAFYPTTSDAFCVSTADVPGSFLFAPEVSYGQSYVTTGGTEFFTEPNTSTSFNPAYFGPNARFTAVPEPATLTLLAMGGLMLARRRR